MRIEGAANGSVCIDGKPLSPKRSQIVWNHSPTGFAWGYEGSGPAQLALAILLAAGFDAVRAVHWHQAFKREHIAPLPFGRAFVLEVDVDAWEQAKATGTA